MKRNAVKPSVVSLFTCGMGMDIGFEKAGFIIKYTNDIASFACNTIRKMRPNIICDEGDISKIRTSTILKKIHLKKGEVDVVIGGPPCQPFSTAGTRNGFEAENGHALLEFIRIIREVRPKMFVFENVSGLKSAAKKHRSFYKRITQKKIAKKYQLGSLFEHICKKFEKIDGYNIDWDVLNAADYGVAQKRKRLILIGSRISDPKIIFDELKSKSKYADPKKAKEQKKKNWRTLGDEIFDINDPRKEHTNFPRWKKYLKYVPPGGCWIDLPKDLRRRAMGGAANTNDPKRKGKQGGRRGYYRRLSWDKPCPTLVTSPTQLGTCLCHPDEDRPLTVKEYAKIQGFPTNWKFQGSITQKYRMIGEAIPIKLSKTIAGVVKIYVKENRLK